MGNTISNKVSLPFNKVSFPFNNWDVITYIALKVIQKDEKTVWSFYRSCKHLRDRPEIREFVNRRRRNKFKIITLPFTFLTPPFDIRYADYIHVLLKDSFIINNETVSHAMERRRLFKYLNCRMYYILENEKHIYFIENIYLKIKMYFQENILHCFFNNQPVKVNNISRDKYDLIFF